MGCDDMEGNTIAVSSPSYYHRDDIVVSSRHNGSLVVFASCYQRNEILLLSSYHGISFRTYSWSQPLTVSLA